MTTPLRVPTQPTGIQPTDEQKSILQDFLSGETVVASALAGTGKTSTLVLCARARDDRGAYWAFNKAIAEEAKYRMPSRVKSRTASSFAYNAMIQVCPWIEGKVKRRVEPWKMARHLGITKSEEFGGKTLRTAKLANLTFEMVGNFCDSDDRELSTRHGPFLRGLEATYASDGTRLTASSLPDLADYLLPYAEAYWHEVTTKEARHVRFDFAHYMKMWALGDWITPMVPGDYVMVDEAQDLNPVEIGILERMDKQLLIVGDANQQIYEFRGSVNAMNKFGIPPEQHLPLTMSFRFGEEVADVANDFLGHLGALHVVRGNPAKQSAVHERGKNEMVADAVLTRTNAGALEMLLSALDSGIERIAVTGRVQGMQQFVEAAVKMQAGEIVTHPDLTMFKTWREVQEYVASTNDQDYALLVKVIDTYGAERLAGALDSTVELKDAELSISTAHSAKGLEWEKVRIGHDFDRSGDDNQAATMTGLSDPELRLAYVACTRAIGELDCGGLSPLLFNNG